MAVKLNKSGEAHLRDLIDAGKYSTEQGWDFTADDGNALLGDKGEDWGRYASVHLGEDDGATEDTKARWKYPAAKAKGDSEEASRAGLVAAKDRAGQSGDKEIEDAASSLIDLIDKKEGKGSKPASASPARDLPRLMTRIFGTPLLMAPAKIDVIINALGPRIGFTNAVIDQSKFNAVFGGDDDDDDGETPSQYQTTPDGIASICVDGTLVYKSSWLGALSGLTGYGDVKASLDAALADPAVKGILLCVDSYGGEVNGCFDLSDAVYAARAQKPVYAVAADDAYSAAYALLSSASKVFVSRTSGVGSIGVVALHIDQSAADKQEGLKYTYIKAGAKKTDGNPHEPLSASAEASMQSETDRLWSLFANSVAKYRGIAAEDVFAMQAACYFGDNAVAAKLADAIGTPIDAMNALRGEIAARVQAAQMSFSAAPPMITAEAPAPAPAAAADTAQVIDLAAERLRITGEAASTHAEIIELCALASRAELAAGFIRKNTSVPDVRKELQTLRARASDALAVTGHIMPDAGGTDAQQAAAGWTKAFAAIGGKKQGDAK